MYFGHIMTLRFSPPFTVLLLTATLSACMVGPDYVKPSAHLSKQFKEQKPWQPAQPRDHTPTGKWWEIFKDVQLNALEAQVATANQSLIQAEAQYRQAQHLVQSAQSSLFPMVNSMASTNRFRAATGQSVAVSGVRNLFATAISSAWEPDLWGGVRRQIEANTGAAQASAASLQALRLSMQGNLADYYFQIKTLDAQKALLEETASAYNKALTIIKNRYAVGVVAKSDVAKAETQLKATQARAIDLGVQRAQLEHAVAVLIGKTPAEVSIRPNLATLEAPPIPLTLPSELLERRPDIAAAERRMASANAQIGVAKAAYFPSLNLAASNGLQSGTLSTLFTAARRYWALGPAGAALTLFDGGAKNAQYRQAIDSFDASVAGYRQTVLAGFQEVEDQLAAVRILNTEIQVQNEAVAAADQALALTINQYLSGMISYQDVIIVQTETLNNKQTALQLQGRRLTASVLLIKALGGGWHEKMLPSPEAASGDSKWTDYLIFPIN